MSDLPDTLPIFPLTGALLLPGGTLPLNIFEPRYVAMVEDALKGDRVIGMIQPTGERMRCNTPCIHTTGCAGAISEYTQTEDGRYLIALTGLRRFHVREEIASLRGYRRIRPEWLQEAPTPTALDRQRLLPALGKYLARQGLECSLEAAATCNDTKLLTTLAMICPFSPAEQQALLEAKDNAARAELLTCLIEMGSMGNCSCAH